MKEKENIGEIVIYNDGKFDFTEMTIKAMEAIKNDCIALLNCLSFECQSRNLRMHVEIEDLYSENPFYEGSNVFDGRFVYTIKTIDEKNLDDDEIYDIVDDNEEYK